MLKLLLQSRNWASSIVVDIEFGRSTLPGERIRFMQRREIEIVNTLGLNAPASAKLAQLASKYQCEVSLARSGRKVNAKSLMGVMMLAAGKGSRVVLETDGPDETEALDAIVALIGEHFGEGQ
jgi:phosphocarrier protein